MFNLIDNLIARKVMHRIWPSEGLLGAPVDSDWYRAHIKQSKWNFFRRLVSMWWTANKPDAVNSLGKKTRPTRMLLVPANALVVLSPSRSEDYLKRQKENLEYDTAGIALLTDEELRSLYEKYTLTWNLRQARRGPKKGFCAWQLPEEDIVMYFMLHFKGWVHCMESGEPVLIAEYGTAPPPVMPDVRFKHLAVLTPQGFFRHESLAIEQTFRFPQIISPHCYALTPDGAHRLVEAAGRRLLVSLRSHMHRMIKRLHVVHYPVVSRQMNEEVLRVIAEASPKPPQATFWRDY